MLLNVAAVSVPAGQTVVAASRTAAQEEEVCRVYFTLGTPGAELRYRLFVTPAGGTRRALAPARSFWDDFATEELHLHLAAGDKVEVEATNPGASVTSVTAQPMIAIHAAGAGGAAAVVAPPTFFAYTGPVAFAANKHHLAVMNALTSGRVVRLRKLFATNLQLAAVTGVRVEFHAKRATAVVGGTAVIPVPADSAEELPAGITVATGPTVTEGAVLFPWLTVNEEETTVQALSKAQFQQAVNILIDSMATGDLAPLTLRPGEGFTMKQITSSSVGSFGWLLVFTVE